jgi:hypothetical protein
MSFSPLWIEGTIHNTVVGRIPKELLLLCLVPQRIARADDRILSRLCKDLELYNIIGLAIDEWGLQQEYKGVRYYYCLQPIVLFLILIIPNSKRLFFCFFL